MNFKKYKLYPILPFYFFLLITHIVINHKLYTNMS